MNPNKIHFPSLAAVGRYIETTPAIWPYRDSRDWEPQTSWDLRAGWEGAMELARNGWLDGANGINTKLKAFKALETMPQTVRGFAGNRVHMPAYIAGSPKCMLRKTAGDISKQKVVRLIVQVNANSEVRAECMSNLGTAIARYVRERETQGTRCEVIAAITSLVNGERICHTWTVKSASQPLNMPALAFSIGHPAAFRRLGFALRERTTARPDSSYGSAMELQLDDLPTECPRGNAIVITGMRRANSIAPTPEAALAYLKSLVADHKA